jgi:hypothetical protein
MTVLDTGDVATMQAGALFDVALGEFLFLAQFAKAVADYHGGDYYIEAEVKQLAAASKSFIRESFEEVFRPPRTLLAQSMRISGSETGCSETGCS